MKINNDGQDSLQVTCSLDVAHKLTPVPLFSTVCSFHFGQSPGMVEHEQSVDDYESHIKKVLFSVNLETKTKTPKY